MIRLRVAQHPNTPTKILEKLTKDEITAVRQYAIKNLENQID
jgi:hypothetical protein